MATLIDATKEILDVPFVPRNYPKELETVLCFGEHRDVLIRPIRPDDAALLVHFLEKISPEDKRLRFFATVREFSTSFIARLTQLDYHRAMALVAIDPISHEMLGVVRLHSDESFESGEYAVLVRSDLKGQGLGWKLMELIIAFARGKGLKSIEGEVLTENTMMLTMCRELGFEIIASSDDPQIRHVRLNMSLS